VTLLPATIKDDLTHHVEGVHALHLKDLEAGAGWMELPGAITRKYPNAGREWGW
jgi:hypothetical protein